MIPSVLSSEAGISQKPMDPLAASVAERIGVSTRIVFLTGAGISAESGVPTFRGAEGIWQKFRPEELANFDAFINNPELVQSWYSHRKELAENVTPNAGHFAITELQRKVTACHVVTQNVDNLHQRAGNKNVIELHGNIFRNYCIECGRNFDENNHKHVEGSINHCEACGGLIRPDVVWFGEEMPPEALQKAESLCSQTDVLLSVGTSGAVYPAAGLPSLARKNGAFLVEINPQATEISSLMDVVLRKPSGIALPGIVEMIQ